MFKGVYTAVITPFVEGSVDEETFAGLLDWQVSQGVQGVVIGGTTGESPTLSPIEYTRLLAVAREVASAHVNIIVGAGTPSTEDSIALCQLAQKAGADGVLVVNPYYNRPSQEGIFCHYQTIHDAINLPILLYNNPARSAGEISIPTVLRLAELERVVGIKDASPTLSRVTEIHHHLGEDFIQLGGNDGDILAHWAMGGQGWVSVVSNVAPALCATLYQALLEGDLTTGFDLRDQLFPLIHALSCDTNPVPVKYALSLMGYGNGELRLPLVPLSPLNQEKVAAIMSEIGLLNSYE